MKAQLMVPIKLKETTRNIRNVYLTEEYEYKIERLIARLVADGHDITDVHGNYTVNALLKFLVDEKLKQLDMI